MVQTRFKTRSNLDPSSSDAEETPNNDVRQPRTPRRTRSSVVARQSPISTPERDSPQRAARNTHVQSKISFTPTKSPAVKSSKDEVFDVKEETNAFRQFLSQAKDSLSETGPDFAEAGLYDSVDPVNEALKEVLRMEESLKNDQNILQQFNQALTAAKANLNGERPITEDCTFTQHIQEFEQNSRAKPIMAWSKNPTYSNYHDLLWELGPGHNNKLPAPPIADDAKSSRADASVMAADDQMEVNLRRNYVCPISMTLLENPVTNNACKHSYSIAALRSIMHQEGQNMRCPVSGCNAVVNLKSVHNDVELKKHVDRLKSRIFP